MRTSPRGVQLEDLISIAQAAFVVGLAELGDKSQLVLLTLATRYSALPVFLGAVAAFALLNGLAAAFGAVLATAVPPVWLNSGAGLLFLVFGALALWNSPEEEDPEGQQLKRKAAPWVVAFAMVFAAEFGDKTQLTVTGLASVTSPLDAWAGATAGLALTTALVTLASRSLVDKLPKKVIYRISGLVFLAVGLWTLWGAFSG